MPQDTAKSKSKKKQTFKHKTAIPQPQGCGFCFSSIQEIIKPKEYAKKQNEKVEWILSYDM